MKTYEEMLLSAADAYHVKTGKAYSTLGILVANDGKFFDRIRNGGGVTTPVFKRVVSWFAAEGIDLEALPHDAASAEADEKGRCDG